MQISLRRQKANPWLPWGWERGGWKEGLRKLFEVIGMFIILIVSWASPQVKKIYQILHLKMCNLLYVSFISIKLLKKGGGKCSKDMSC